MEYQATTYSPEAHLGIINTYGEVFCEIFDG